MAHGGNHSTYTQEQAVKEAERQGIPSNSYTCEVPDGSGGRRLIYYKTDGSSNLTPLSLWNDMYVAPAPCVRCVTGAGQPCNIADLRRPGWSPGDYTGLETSSTGEINTDVGEVNFPYLHDTAGDLDNNDPNYKFIVPLIIESPAVVFDQDGNAKYSSTDRMLRVLNTDEIIALSEEADDSVKGYDEVGDELYDLENWTSAHGDDTLVDDDGPVGTINVEDWAARTRLKEQCYLLANIKEFSRFNQRLDAGYQWAGRWNSKAARDKAVTVVQGPTFNVQNLLTNNNLQQEWFNLTPDQMSMLVPTINIFKIVEKPVESTFTHIEFGELSHTEICEKVIEIPFFNNPKDEMGNSYDPGVALHEMEDVSFEELNNLSEFGRGLGGIKSFSWDYVGNNPVSARTDVNAKLELYFQKFEDLVRPRVMRVYSDDPLAPGEDHHWQYIDLALRSGDIGNESQVVNGRAVSPYKLRVHVGWAVPPDFHVANQDSAKISASFTDEEIRAIEESFVTLYLTVIDHTFDIQDDASVKFTIEYKAYIESTFGDPQRADILLTQDIANRRKYRQEQLELARETCSAEDVAEVKKRQQEEIDIEKSLAHETIINALEHHAGWVNGLPGPDSNGAIGQFPYIETSRRSSRIYQMSLDESVFKTFVEEGPFSYNSHSDDLRTKLGAGSGAVSSGGDVTQRISDRIAAAGGFDSSNLSTSLNKLTGFDGSVEDMDTARRFHLQWFYFGDLVHVAMERLEENSGLLYVPPSGGAYDSTNSVGGGSDQIYKSRIVLGPFDVVDPLTEEVFQINLADIPISVNYFVDWFMQKIISKQEATYPLMTFIREALNDLVMRTMNDSENCFGGSIRQKAVYNSTYLIAKETDRGEVGGVNGRAQQRAIRPGYTEPIDQLQKFEEYCNGIYVGRLQNGSLDTHHAGKLLNTGFPQQRLYTNLISDSNLVAASCNNPLLATFREDMEEIGQTICRDLYYKYAVITLSNGHMPELRGRKHEDMERNVLWYHIGSPSGPIKNMKFNKTDMKGVKEARFFREGFNGLAQLREPYDVNISTYGMPRVFPGQMIYVDPIGMGSGLGSPGDLNSIAYLLGFGGYHQIIKIKNSIKAGDYTTDIEAKWISTGNAADPRRGTLIGEGTTQGQCSVLTDTNIGLSPPGGNADPSFDGGPWPEEEEEEYIGGYGSGDIDGDGDRDVSPYGTPVDQRGGQAESAGLPSSKL